MIFFLSAVWFLILCSRYAEGMRNVTFSVEEIDSGEALKQLASQASQNMNAQELSSSSCRKENVRVRREW